MQTILGAASASEKLAIYPDPYKETSKSAMHGSHEISRGTHKLIWTPKVIKNKIK